MIKVIDNFKRRPSDRHPTLDLSKYINSAYDGEIKDMTRLAERLNRDNKPVVLDFVGSYQTRLRCIVSCEDKELETKIDQTLKQYLKNKDET